jgi:hypothetical protein
VPASAEQLENNVALSAAEIEHRGARWHKIFYNANQEFMEKAEGW